MNYMYKCNPKLIKTYKAAVNMFKIILLCCGIYILFSLSIPATAMTDRLAVVRTDSLLVRREARVNSQPVDVLYKDQAVRIIDRQGDWFMVTYSNTTGYIQTKYLKTSNITVANMQPHAAKNISGNNQNIEQPELTQQEQLEQLQNVLLGKGYLGVVDGVFAAKTQDAVSAALADREVRAQQTYYVHADNDIENNDTNEIKQASGEVIASADAVAQTDKTPADDKNKNASGEIGEDDIPTIMNALSQAGETGASRASVELLDWWDVVRYLLEEGDIMRVTDVETQKQFQVRILYVGNHADCEPLTAQDTAIMKECYNGKWSWDRRAVVVEINGRMIAASMNGMPHMGYHIKDNNFDGHFCIHFLNSRRHWNNKICPIHQEMIQKAYNYYN